MRQQYHESPCVMDAVEFGTPPVYSRPHHESAAEHAARTELLDAMAALAALEGRLVEEAGRIKRGLRPEGPGLLGYRTAEARDRLWDILDQDPESVQEDPPPAR